MANVSQLSSTAERYINGYLSLEVQSADSGPTDPQLASVIFAVVERISESDSGVIIDVGCGSGMTRRGGWCLPPLVKTRQGAHEHAQPVGLERVALQMLDDGAIELDLEADFEISVVHAADSRT